MEFSERHFQSGHLTAMGTQKFLRKVLPKNLWGDRLYCRYRFYKKLGRLPQSRPTLFNDYLFALKTSGACYDPLIQFVTDKEYAKHYFSSIVGSEFVIETYDILRNRDELEDYVPRKFPCVLKPTHSSGQAVVCIHPHDPFDREALAGWFELDRYRAAREQNYRYLIPKIIVEEYFSEDNRTVPNDYKIFCFDGIPKLIQVDTDRFTSQSQSFYNIEWNRIPVVALYPGKEKDEPKPMLLDRMLELARELSAPFPFVRVDMYATATEIRIGELTFIPWSGLLPLQPAEAEVSWGAFFDRRNGG